MVVLTARAQATGQYGCLIQHIQEDESLPVLFFFPACRARAVAAAGQVQPNKNELSNLSADWSRKVSIIRPSDWSQLRMHLKEAALSILLVVSIYRDDDY